MAEKLSNKPNIPDNDYDHHSDDYVELSETDPSKKWVQYRESMRLIREQFGNLKGKTVLDIGCANGKFTRMMAREGAKVVGYDPSNNEVQKAQKIENEHPLGIKYFVSDRPAINPDHKFDATTAILVLSLMEDDQQLEQMFGNAYESLKSGGKFVALTINPDFNQFGQKVYNRCFNKTGEGNKYTLDFFDNDGNFKFTINGTQFSKEQHEQAALSAGFKSVEWKGLKVDPAGIAEQGEEFWRNYEENCPYIGLVAHKE